MWLSSLEKIPLNREEEKEKMDDGAKIDNGEPDLVEQTLTEMIFGPNLAKHASVPAKRKK